MKKLIIFIVFMFLCIFKVNAATEPPLLYGNLTWNIENIYYYVDSSASNYASIIAKSANNWVYTGYGYNRLWPNTRAYNISNAAMDIYGYSSVDGSNGYTIFFARTNGTTGNIYQVNQNSTNWLFSEIYLNNYYLASETDTNKQATITHEMGHVFGLNENNSNPYSIMCQAASGRAVYLVQQVDNNAFNRKHP